MQRLFEMGEASALLKREVAGEFPDARGRFGPYGGRYVPETLVPALDRLEAGVHRWLDDPEFIAELDAQLSEWVGRPTALSYAPTLSARWGAKVYLKREDLAHTGAHKINNAIGQALLAQRLGAKRIVAEGGKVSLWDQNAMKLLGATVVPVTGGDQTLRAAIDEALRDWVADPNGTYYLLGSAVGPHPYPLLVRRLQSVIGREARAQMIRQTGGLPDAVFACVGGGSNSIGMFHPFIGDESVRLIGLEAGGRGPALGDNSATLTMGRPGVLQGCYSMLLQDADGQIQETHSISAGLDYPGVGPEHSLLMSTGRVQYEYVTDDEALESLSECCAAEGIIPAIETAHAFTGARKWAAQHPGATLVICLSGRGDKDMPTLQRTLLKGKL